MAVLRLYADSKFEDILLFGAVVLLSHEKSMRRERVGSISIRDNPLARCR